MSERITAYSLDVRPVVYDRVTRIPLFAGGREGKSYFTAHDVVSNTDTSFVQRRFDPDFIRNWKRMNAVGLPVVPEIFLNPGRDFMLTPDVKADGSEVYGKGLRDVLEGRYRYTRERPRPEIDEIFLELTAPQNIPMILQAAKSVASIANAHSVELPSEDPMELIIHPDKSWGIISLDLDSAKLDEREPEEMNEFHCQTIMSDLVAIRRSLISNLSAS